MLSVIIFHFDANYSLFSQLINLYYRTVKQLIFILAIIFLFTECKGPLSAPEAKEVKPGMHKVVVNEVIQAGGYTYLNVSEKRKKIWLALPAMQAVKGDQFYFNGGLQMTDFFSKELNRTFPSVLFLENVNKEPIPEKNAGMNNTTLTTRVRIERINISIEPGEGCVSIAKLLADKSTYSQKRVRVRGKITKFNAAIMGRNWIHVQDGSEYNGAFDLTITTDSELAVGDTVTFEGRITLKKDFGYGYFYDVIMEDGKLVK